ncbi:MAG: FG-GAP-like repeat-containing protein [Janthinobacterium lividum]
MSPRYPARSPLEDVLRLVAPGTDEYVTEKHAFEIGTVLQRWSLLLVDGKFEKLQPDLAPSLLATSFIPAKEMKLRSGDSVETLRREFSPDKFAGADRFVQGLRTWIGREAEVLYADLEIVSVREVAQAPLTVHLEIRYSVLTRSKAVHRCQAVGTWSTEWSQDPAAAGTWKLTQWQALSETQSVARHPVFVDVSEQAMASASSYREQLQRGSDDWRSVLDGACGIDIYGNNGIAFGDYDDDGFDDMYVSQPAGLPNRLYRNRGNGTFEDVTDKAGVGVLDNTSCALFADLRNVGLQDLVVVCGSGPLLFVNQGDGTFRAKRDAFRFARPPQGTFTHAAIADYDLDGRLDIYFCLYSYYLGLDQYHYPVPYFDARNGPPNFLFHNQGDGTFLDATEAAGLNVDNDRYSFACAWGESAGGKSPDLYVVNDFGRNVFYQSNGNGTFAAASTKAHVEDVGAGMSACWADTANDGRQDLYVANMWSAAGQRVSQQPIFHKEATNSVLEMYRRHAEGNALYKNDGGGTFRNASQQAGVDAGRWAWCSDFWDFDHDGYADLYVTNGYITAPEKTPDATTERVDLGSFFWRQVVGKSPDDSTPSLAYEHGWNALNELIRSDRSWSGHERNVMFANNRDGTFTEVSGAVGLDFLEDGRSFALADLDGDGRLEVVVKNRTAPQLRVLHNVMESIGDSLAFRLKGTKSNRDGIGTSITLEIAGISQKKYLQAGSGFLAQHTKQIFFGLGKSQGNISATVQWPSGLKQQFSNLPRNNCVSLIEGDQTFSSLPFRATPYTSTPGQAQRSDRDIPVQENIETWLIDPLKAPAFTLRDAAGKTVELSRMRGSFVLLHFWSADHPGGSSNLIRLQQRSSSFASAGLQVIALRAASTEKATSANASAGTERFTFPVVSATEEVLGIYNIIYRYLYDRRRDLPLPCSFLVDREGMIVKIYQGTIQPDTLLQDVRSSPATAAARMQKALPFAGLQYQADFLRNDFTYGVAMFQHGYLDQAAESFQQVIATRPDNAEGYYNLGTLSLRRNNFPQARTYLQQTLKLKPDYPEAWNNLGMMAAQEGHAEEAIRNFQQSLQLRPGYAVALLNLGNVYRRQGDVVKAKDALTRALLLQPDDPEANYSVGMFYAQQNSVAAAEDHLRKAVSLRPDYPEALNNLGVLLVRKQSYAEAEQQFKICIRLNPAFDQSYLNLARLYVLLQRTSDARSALQQLLKVKPDSAVGKQALQMLEPAS